MKAHAGVDHLIRLLDAENIARATVLSILSTHGLETKIVEPTARCG